VNPYEGAAQTDNHGAAGDTSGSGVLNPRRPTLVHIDGWIHVPPGDCEMRYLIPMQQGKNGWLQQPYGELRIADELDVLINGRPVLWSLLDALFPDDPLPRTHVNEAIKDDSVAFLDDLNAMLKESDVPNISIQIGTMPDPVTASRLDWLGLAATTVMSSTIQGVSEAQDAAALVGGEVRPATWKDKKGTHVTACILVPTGKGFVQAIDVGSRFVVSGYVRTNWGPVRPLRADIVRKGAGWPLALRERVNAHQQAILGMDESLVWPPWTPVLSELSSERMAQEHDFFLQGVPFC
jgi:hypothetical protein